MPRDEAKFQPRPVRKPRCDQKKNLQQALHDITDQPRLPPVDVGQKLRDLRAARGLTLRSLSELSGLNVNTLSMIENARTSPSVSTLQQLAFALDAPITSFFEAPQVRKSVVYHKANQSPRLCFSTGSLAELGAGLAKKGAEPFLVELQPRAESGPAAVVHTGLEFVFCLEGELKYTIQDDDFLLSAGDSLLFEAHLPHRWQNAGAGVSRSLLVFCPSDVDDQPVARHFSPLDHG